MISQEHLKPSLKKWFSQRSGPSSGHQFEGRWGEAQQAVADLSRSLWGDQPPDWSIDRRPLLQAFLFELLCKDGLILNVRQGPGPAGLKARVDLEARTVTIFRQAVLEVAQALVQETPAPEKMALLMLLSHESWHILRPQCPSDYCELAAHLWCASLTGQIYLEATEQT